MPISRLLMALLCVACDSASRVITPRSAVIALKSSSSGPGIVPATFVSIADSVVISITPSGNRLPVVARGRKLVRRQTEIDFTDISLTDGAYRVDAMVMSALDTLLYVGAQSFNVTNGQFNVDVTLLPEKPVLVVAPDTVTVHLATASSLGFDTLRIYNRGLDSLAWAIDGSSGCLQQGCMKPGNGAGKIPRDSSFLLNLTSVAPLSAPTTIRITSPEGAVAVVVRTVVGQ